MKQRTLAMMTGFEQYARKKRRAIFLEEMGQVVPWRELCALVEPHDPKPGNQRPPVGVECMPRIYFCGSGSTYRTRRSKSRCTTRQGCASSWGLIWAARRCRSYCRLSLR